MFIDNKYTKLYFKIIDSKKERIFEHGEYFERHHIIPKSIGGNNAKNNIIKLTAKEHFICHRLLVKMTQGKDKVKMSYALRCMIKRENRHQKRYKLTSRKYQQIILETKKVLSENSIGENNSFFGKKHDKETKLRMSELRKERSKQGIIEGMTGKNHSEETKEKLRRAASNQFSSKENREIQRQKALEQYKDPDQRYKAGNGKRGKNWYYDPIALISILCFEKDKPEGYIKGRVIKKEKEVVA